MHCFSVLAMNQAFDTIKFIASHVIGMMYGWYCVTCVPLTRKKLTALDKLLFYVIPFIGFSFLSKTFSKHVSCLVTSGFSF